MVQRILALAGFLVLPPVLGSLAYQLLVGRLVVLSWIPSLLLSMGGWAGFWAAVAEITGYSLRDFVASQGKWQIHPNAKASNLGRTSTKPLTANRRKDHSHLKQSEKSKAMVQIFLSYAREDEEKVEDLYQRLSDAGFKPWMDKRDILPGERWASSIRGAIRDSDFFLVCLSTNSVKKRGWVQREMKQALDLWQEKLEDDIYLIPVRLEDCEAPESLHEFQWVNVFEEDGWTQLVRAIQIGMERRSEGVTPVRSQADALQAPTETPPRLVDRSKDRSLLRQLEKELERKSELLEATEKRLHKLRMKKQEYGAIALSAEEAAELREREKEVRHLREEIVRLEAQIRDARKRSFGDSHS